ncbi:MAG TPA: glutathione S-transferase family protein [Alphaproteobacteria bacterium]|nr:glutathione S-transferase family protein [Alphaproteobacteria bacterium]HAJ45860.1 glutathione S-transferase family protein [Alphaproteobacteria bacterium]
MPQTIIFHHYWPSPFSEKIRIIFGMKAIPWQSVEIPSMLPKPDLMPLTGGYRKTPVMQIGADIYCDTQLIIRELERRFPERPIVRRGTMAFPAAFWSDRPFFQATIPLLMGKVGHMLPEAFKADRSKMFPDRPFDYDAMKSVIPQMRDQWRAHLGFIDENLMGDFLGGAAPDVNDAHAYMNVWFLANTLKDDADALLKEYPKTAEWAARVKAIGHGSFSKLEAADALAIAKAASPAAQPHTDPHEPNGRKPGDKVAITPDDYGRDTVTGELIFSSAQEIAIRRHDPQVGEVAVHFPRAGFWVTPA